MNDSSVLILFLLVVLAQSALDTFLFRLIHEP